MVGSVGYVARMCAQHEGYFDLILSRHSAADFIWHEWTDLHMKGRERAMTHKLMPLESRL